MFKRWNADWYKETVIEIIRIFAIHIEEKLKTVKIVIIYIRNEPIQEHIQELHENVRNIFKEHLEK